jgi:UDP-N-acetyl-D-mannosaminuronate dehydrogenase
MNELVLIFERLYIGIMDGIKAASTKWNFNVYYWEPESGGTACRLTRTISSTRLRNSAITRR